MSSVETTELKLKTTPTGGVDVAQSPYYRRLLSAGYKGFLQGTIGGGALYGAMGAVIGGLMTIPLFFIPGMPILAALAIIPAGAGLGIVKGASTFGNIGSTAAINAESADLSEQRRYLLDRYYDLPEGPAGDKEAAVIREELNKRTGDTQRPAHFFHWKTVVIGALIGAAIAGVTIAVALAGMTAAGAGVAAVGAEALTSNTLIGLVQSSIGLNLPQGIASVLVTLGVPGITAIGSLAGAVTGSAIGIDRYYIRKWFDHTQDVVHSSSHKESALMERQQQVERLQEAAKADEKTKLHIRNFPETNTPATTPTASLAHAAPELPAQKPIANLSETPGTKISNATLQSRLADIQKTMEMAPL